MVGPGNLGHGSVVGFDVFDALGPGVAGDVVGASENDDDFGLEVDDVLAEADEHLRSSLSTDAAVDISLAGEIFVELPDVGDGISEEDDAVLIRGGRLEGSIGRAVAAEFSEVIAKDGSFVSAVLFESLLGSELGLLLGKGGEGEEKNDERNLTRG